MTSKAPTRDSKSTTTEGPILVAVDFTDDSKAALVWAGEYAACVGAPILVLHVVHDPAEAPGYYRKDENNLLQPIEDIAAEMMVKFLEEVAQARPDLEAMKSASSQLIKGLPATRILEIASKIDARMIVMGSRGRTGLPHLLLGSKAERVVQLSPIPVTIVKAPNDET